MLSPDVVIAGAGLIGLSCALECERRGLRTLVLERDRALRQASWAAAGMLAAHDPANPPELSALAQQSIALYPDFLERIATLGGAAVPIETECTLEEDAHSSDGTLLTALQANGFRLIREQSLDPRKLASALLAAVRNSTVTLREDTAVSAVSENGNDMQVQTDHGMVACGSFLDCTGAWSAAPVRPAKGQMLRVYAPGVMQMDGRGNVVVRNRDIYLVPRLEGSVVIGATVEDAGFDTAVHATDLQDLRQRAAALVPAIADAPSLESWAGLRPDTPDHLPLLGRVGERTFVAAGHFRNGVLLAPATARIAAQMLTGETQAIDLTAFAPSRFAP